MRHITDLYVSIGLVVSVIRLIYLLIAILAETSRDMEEMKRLLSESSKIGLEMNASKTIIMTNSQKRAIVINGNGNVIEYVSYIYLGKQLSFNKSSDEEEGTRKINII